MWLTPPGPYRATSCLERVLTLDHIILFWPHKDMEILLGWGISSMPGPPPTQHEHEKRYTPFAHPFIIARRIWKGNYDGQMIFGDLGLKLPDIYLTGEEKPRKSHTQETCTDRGIEPRPAAWQGRMLPPAPQWWTFSAYSNIKHLPAVTWWRIIRNVKYEISSTSQCDSFKISINFYLRNAQYW